MPKKKDNPGIHSSDHVKIWEKMDCLDSKLSDLKNEVIKLVTWNNVWRWAIPIIVVLTVLILGKLITL